MQHAFRIRSFLTTLTAFLGLGSALAGTIPSPSPTNSYEFKDLGATIGRRHSNALAINDHNQVVGSSYNTLSFSTPIGGDSHATVWLGAKAIDLGTLGGSYSNAVAINNHGQIVGESDTSDGSQRHAILWNRGRITDIGAPLAKDTPYSSARGINLRGTIVGISGASPVAAIHGILFREKGVQLLPNPPGTSFNTAVALNDAGDATGYAFFGGDVKTVLWKKNSVTVLDLLKGGSTAIPTAINDSGVIVGFSTCAVGAVHAAMWTDGKVVDLGTLQDPAGSSQARAINRRGVVVGYSQVDDGTLRAVQWTNGEIVDLNTYLPSDLQAAGWVLAEANGINRQGSIVGYMQNTKTGVTHAFILIAKRSRKTHDDNDSH